MYIYVGELKKTFCRNVFINKYVFNDDYPISVSLSIYIDIYIYRERERNIRNFLDFGLKSSIFQNIRKKQECFVFRL